MSNSNLVSYTKISPHRSSPRRHAIDTISIHCVAAQASIESLGEVFQRKEASANYGIGPDGRVGMYVEECDRSWCTSSSSNDNRAITIEVASDNYHPYAVTDKAMESLIELLVDICRRNGIPELRWKNDKSLIGHPDQQNMTVHRWFANKACPGEYLLSRHGEIAARVNQILSGKHIFVDVPAGAYYHDAVMWAAENGVASGTGEMRFEPESPCTRAQAVTMMYAMAGSPDDIGDYHGFSDVQPTAYYAPAVQWAVDRKITSGVDRTHFAPDAPCTRGQIVTFLWRMAGSPDKGSETFSDVDGSDYFQDAVSWAQALGITGGVGNGKFAPEAQCTRAQIVTMLYRAKDHI